MENYKNAGFLNSFQRRRMLEFLKIASIFHKINFHCPQPIIRTPRRETTTAEKTGTSALLKNPPSFAPPHNKEGKIAKDNNIQLALGRRKFMLKSRPLLS